VNPWQDRVIVVRNGVVESSHAVHVAVVDARGRTVALGGDPIRSTYFRSSAKPLQALPLIEDGVAERWAFEDSELALCCASHGGEPEHVSGVRALLQKTEIDEASLECGAHLPMHVPSAHDLIQSGASAERIHNNCSGKHAGMLALAKHHGWPLKGYRHHDHPVQQRMLDEVSRWTGLQKAAIGVGVDGCGVSCFSLPVVAMAEAYAGFAEAAENGGAAGAIVAAMTGHPWRVAGTGRLCTALMQATSGSVFAKVGAEGVYGAGIPERGWGVALKVEDGGWRAAEVALLSVLDQVGALHDVEAEALVPFRPRRLVNTCGDEVGTITAEIELRTHGA